MNNGPINPSDMPPLLTEEEVERKARMMKAAGEVAEAVDTLKKELETRGWSSHEQAALMLFNTMLMTSFSQEYNERAEKNDKQLEDRRERLMVKIVERLRSNGFVSLERDEEIVRTCVTMILDSGSEDRAVSVWNDYFGDNTAGSLLAAFKRAKDELEKEIEDEEKRAGRG